MQVSNVNEKYLIHKPLLETQGVNIYAGYTDEGPASHTVTIHSIRHKLMIKYYLTQLEVIRSALPLEDSFVHNNELCLVFKSHETGLPIYHHSFRLAEKKQFFLSLLAKLAVDKHLPNFFKWQLINLETLIVDRNQILQTNIHFKLLNPDHFNDFAAIQNRIAEIIPLIFEEPKTDPALKQFLQNCIDGIYLDSLDMLKDYKRLIDIQHNSDEPWFYAFLYDRYQALRKNSKRFVGIIILLLMLNYGLNYFKNANEALVQPYVKTTIGLITYDDPYTEPLEKEETISVKAVEKPPEPAVPVPVAVKPTPPEPEYETHIVQSGEYLLKISKTQYGDSKYAWALAKYNDLENPSYLPVGYPLKIPTLKIIETIFQGL